jgi:DNA-binding NtrC family response regulator
MRPSRVLIVDDEEGIREVCSDALERLGRVEIVTEGDPVAAAKRLEDESFDVMVSDIRMPGMTGVELLRHARERDPELPVLMLTGFPSVETAVECLKLGAVDYLTKPFRPEDLVANVGRFLKERRLQEENALLKRRIQREYRFEELIGRSDAMQRVFDVIDRVAESDVDVLIHGETGTGKELVARALHRRSRRKGKRFVAVDCGAIPENLLESEFFGYEKGAFTGAHSRSLGLLEYADEGSFFLDELGELPPLMQAKLLRSLQERTIRRVGGKIEIPVDIRVVAATSRDLAKEVEAERFRQDLYFRVNVVTIDLPSLRERGDDVRLLAQHFVERHAPEMGKNVSGVSPEAMEVLAHYRWPGNVRELQNVIRRGLALSRGEEITVDDLPERLVVNAGDGLVPREEKGFFELRAEHVAAFEAEFLASTLDAHGGDVAAAARAVKVPRGTYYRLMKNHGLKAADFRE